MMSSTDKKQEQKSQKNKVALSLVGLGVLLSSGSWVLISSNQSGISKEQRASPHQYSKPADAPAHVADNLKSPISTANSDVEKNSGNNENGSKRVDQEANAAQALNSTQVKSILDEFADEQRKVFVSDESSKTRQLRYSDAKILQSLVKLITEPARSDAEKRMQDLAGEFMVAALESGSDGAFQAALEIMKTSAFENPEFPQDSREQMAGVAGEIAYHLLAYRPRHQLDVKTALQGPIGQKIFDNSVQLQTTNLDESLTELAAQ